MSVDIQLIDVEQVVNVDETYNQNVIQNMTENLI